MTFSKSAGNHWTRPRPIKTSHSYMVEVRSPPLNENLNNNKLTAFCGRDFGFTINKARQLRVTN